MHWKNKLVVLINHRVLIYHGCWLAIERWLLWKDFFLVLETNKATWEAAAHQFMLKPQQPSEHQILWGNYLLSLRALKFLPATLKCTCNGLIHRMLWGFMYCGTRMRGWAWQLPLRLPYAISLPLVTSWCWTYMYVTFSVVSLWSSSRKRFVV